RHNVRNFSLHVLEELRPRAVTRDIDWGVPIPLPEFENREDKRIYVWFEAVIGYLSASIEWARLQGRPEAWRAWWQDPSARHFYFMGKDNIIFHSVIWPSILMGYGSGGAFGGGPPNLPLRLPENVVSSEFLTVEGRKFSSSRGVVIEVRDFLSRYDPDALRYYLTAAGPETQDTEFTWSEFIRRNNDELVATWGNLVNRTLSIAQRHFGEVPPAGELSAADRKVAEIVAQGFDSVGGYLEQARFKAGLAEAMGLAARVNQYLAENEPWKLVNQDRGRAASVLHVALGCVNDLKVLLLPFLPFSSQQLHRLLGFSGEIAPMPVLAPVGEGQDAHSVLLGDYSTPEARWAPGRLPVGQRLGQPVALFRKLDPGLAEEELGRLAAGAAD
ncbi:MAG: methionine--tRNA ligase, partial [Candidatus Dormibacteria bacterium]